MFVTKATEGQQGLHRFYSTSLRWGELDPFLIFPEDLKELDDEDRRMQRGLAKNRLEALRHYLLDEKDHFFSALTLIILPRDLGREARAGQPDAASDGEWDYLFQPDQQNPPGHQKPGTLLLSGEVRLFPADGQHRAMAARRALKDEYRLSREEVPVVLVPYHGQDRVRQLFSDLNRNAKPASLTTAFDFETRDPLTLVAKDAARAVPLFEGRTNRVSNSLPRTSGNVIALNTLVQGTKSIVRGLVKAANPDAPGSQYDRLQAGFLSDRENAAQAVAAVWSSIVDAFADKWDRVLAGEEGAAGELREEYLFPHGLGWLALSEAAGRLIEQFGEDWSSRFEEAVKSFDWERIAKTWEGNAVLYNPGTGKHRVNNTAPAVKELADTIVGAVQA